MDDKTKKIEQILATMSQEIGQVPELMLHLSRLDEDFFLEQVKNKQFAMSGEHIPGPYKILMSLAIALTRGNEHCVRTYITLALRKGIDEKMIMETIKLTRYVNSATVLSSARDALKKLDENSRS